MAVRWQLFKKPVASQHRALHALSVKALLTCVPLLTSFRTCCTLASVIQEVNVPQPGVLFSYHPLPCGVGWAMLFVAMAVRWSVL
uniref:Uncharacterized protein n=1 Tax=Rhipicephalus zambeziensis TaxID=60191 RepID=A0A224YAH6_9ACAR